MITASFTRTTAQYANLGLGAISILVTIATVFLIDRLGRRLLLLVGLASVVLVVSLVIDASGQTLHIISLVATVIFVVCFGAGPGKHQLCGLDASVVSKQSSCQRRSDIVVCSINKKKNFRIDRTYPIVDHSWVIWSIKPSGCFDCCHPHQLDWQFSHWTRIQTTLSGSRTYNQQSFSDEKYLSSTSSILIVLL